MIDEEPYPYLIHTGRELELMIAGIKPLSVFAHEPVNGFEKSDALSGQEFGPLVTSGTVSEHVRTFQSQLPNGSTIDIDYYF